MPARTIVFAFVLIWTTCQVAVSEEKDNAEGDSNSNVSYVEIKPAFVVNVSDGDEVHHLQLSISFIPTDHDMEASINEHKPAIRHAIVVLVSGRQISEIRSAQGKMALREQVQQATNKVLQKFAGKPGIKRTLFTEFLIQ